jgi:hypothetical protein
VLYDRLEAPADASLEVRAIYATLVAHERPVSDVDKLLSALGDDSKVVTSVFVDDAQTHTPGDFLMELQHDRLWAHLLEEHNDDTKSNTDTLALETATLDGEPAAGDDEPAGDDEVSDGGDGEGGRDPTVVDITGEDGGDEEVPQQMPRRRIYQPTLNPHPDYDSDDSATWPDPPQ